MIHEFDSQTLLFNFSNGWRNDRYWFVCISTINESANRSGSICNLIYEECQTEYHEKRWEWAIKKKSMDLCSTTPVWPDMRFDLSSKKKNKNDKLEWHMIHQANDSQLFTWIDVSNVLCVRVYQRVPELLFILEWRNRWLSKNDKCICKELTNVHSIHHISFLGKLIKIVSLVNSMTQFE